MGSETAGRRGGARERGCAHGAQGRASRRRGGAQTETEPETRGRGGKGRPLTMGIRSGARSGFAAQAGVGESRPSAVERVRNALLCDALRCATRRGDATGAMGAMTFTFERKAGEGRNLNWTHTRRRAGSWRLSLVGARRDGDAGSVGRGEGEEGEMGERVGGRWKGARVCGWGDNIEAGMFAYQRRGLLLLARNRRPEGRRPQVLIVRHPAFEELAATVSRQLRRCGSRPRWRTRLR